MCTAIVAFGLGACRAITNDKFFYLRLLEWIMTAFIGAYMHSTRARADTETAQSEKGIVIIAPAPTEPPHP